MQHHVTPLLVLCSLIASPASSLKLRQQHAFSDVYYINMAESTERRLTMEEHLASLGVTAIRLEGMSLEASRTGTFSDTDKVLLDKAYGSWGCGSWAGQRCHVGDKVCCWGFDDAVEYTEHFASHRGNIIDKVRGTTYVAASAAKILAMKEIRDKCKLDPAKCLPAVLLEDDARLHPDWERGVADATQVLGTDGFDILKLYGKEVTSECTKQCAHGSQQCFVRNSQRCRHWGAVAYLVNPRSVDKVLGHVEAYSQSFTSSVRLGKMAKTVDVARQRFDWDNWLTKGAEQLNMYTARPPIASVDIEQNMNSTFELFAAKTE